MRKLEVMERAFAWLELYVNCTGFLKTGPAKSSGRAIACIEIVGFFMFHLAVACGSPEGISDSRYRPGCL